MKPYLHVGPKRLGASLVLAGFSLNGEASPYGSEVRTMLGIAYAESSGNAWLVHKNNDSFRSTDYGIWQINDYWEGPILAKYAGIPRTQPIDDFHRALRKLEWSWESYIHNAHMAYLTYTTWYEGPSFRPWIAYRSGALDDPNRVNWDKIDEGIARIKYEKNTKNYSMERIASTYLERLPLAH